MNVDMRKEWIFLPAGRTYLATVPQLTPEVVEELLEHFMDPVHGSNAKGRKTIGMCCLHVDEFVHYWHSRIPGDQTSRKDMKME